jgi:hypothetical protein
MITCDVLGKCNNNSGLGNQLFCIATTLSLALDNSDTPVFPDLKKSHYKFYSKNIFHKLDTGEDKSFVRNYYREPPYSSTLYNKISYLENMCLHGHFQSYKYFEHNSDHIKDTFVLPEKLEISVTSRHEEMLSLKNSVSLHIRRGDYVSDSLKNRYTSLDESYYNEALSIIGDYSKIVVFSDDISWCKEWPFLKDKSVIFVENEFDVIDLILMSKVSNNIIANSTFSWWSAFLNKNTNKKVIAPKEWFGPERSKDNEKETKDLIPSDWIRI